MAKLPTPTALLKRWGLSLQSAEVDGNAIVLILDDRDGDSVGHLDETKARQLLEHGDPDTSSKRPGRPTKLNDTTQQRIVDYMLQGNYLEDAAHASGVSPSTVYKWIAWGQRRTHAGIPMPRDTRPYEEFAKAIEQATGLATTDAVDVWRKGFTKRIPVLDHEGVQAVDADGEPLYRIEHDWRAAAEFLKRRRPEQWGKERIDVTVHLQQYGATMASAFRAVLEDRELALTREQRDLVPQVMARVLPRFVEGGVQPGMIEGTTIDPQETT